jgi:hypothetical protein
MRVKDHNWPTVQETAAILNSTSAEICRLLSIGRLRGTKRKRPGRPGKGQWLVDPKTITTEKKRVADRDPMDHRRKKTVKTGAPRK